MGTYKYTGAAQFVTVSNTGAYDIVAFGAQGGASTQTGAGGYGAEVGGMFELTAGEKLEIIVGGAGKDGAGFGGGGGGGTFVLANIGGTYTPLLVAGGGGGGLGTSNGGGGTLAPGNGQGGTGAGAEGGAGGAGVKSNGLSPSGTPAPGGGSNGSNNYAGGAGGSFELEGAVTPVGGAGGFGGGGGGDLGGGGGGGYSGGNGGNDGSNRTPGSGGGSYDGGVPVSSQTAAGENAGNGRVVFFPNAVICFVTGTRIATTRGDIAVEEMRIGDQVATASGRWRPIRWIGHREIDLRQTPNLDAMPVRVTAGAFGVGVPCADLHLSPGHPVLVGADEDGEGGHLVPIMCLINGTTIRRETVEAITYWHIELGH